MFTIDEYVESGFHFLDGGKLTYERHFLGCGRVLIVVLLTLRGREERRGEKG